MRVGGKWAWVVAWIGLGAAIAIVAGGYPWRIDPERVRAELNAASASPSGMRWARPAAATLTLLPWPKLRVAGVELRTASGQTFLDAPDLEIGLRAGQLLLGRFSAATGALSNPTITFDLDALGLDESSRPPLGSVTIHGGVAKSSAQLGGSTRWSRMSTAGSRGPTPPARYLSRSRRRGEVEAST